MRSVFRIVLVLATTVSGWSASKPHVVGFGKAQTVKIFLNPEETDTVTVSMRPLYIDTKLKEFTTGSPHDITDRQFVVQRAFRINDALPADKPKQKKWLWQRGGWLLVDRSTGHITQIKLPDFDPLYSAVSWYRDYAAYCGISDSGGRVNAVVAQIGARKPVYRKELGRGGNASADACDGPSWERRPPRVTFSPKAGEAFTVNVTTRRAEDAGDSSTEP